MLCMEREYVNYVYIDPYHTIVRLEERRLDKRDVLIKNSVSVPI